VDGSPVRVRLNSPVVRVAHQGQAQTGPVEVVYAGRDLRSVTADHVVLACWHTAIPLLCPELPEKQKEALAFAIKVPLVYTNVFVRSWTSFQKLGVSSVEAPGLWHTELRLDSPVSIGDYHHTKDPAEPIVLHMSKSACQPGLPVRDQHRAGRMELFATSFEQIERSIRNQLARVLGPGGFDPARDILGITVNRWPHGYAYQYNSLFDDFWVNGGEQPCVVARKRYGRIAVANADAGHTRTPTRRSTTGTGRSGTPGRLRRQDVSPVQQPAAVPRTLGLIDLVLLKVVAIVNVNNVPPTAVFGRASLLLWVLAFVAFFIPEAVAVMVMVRRYPGEGGIYLWTRRLFGEGHGFFSGWCYWVNNLFYVPVLLLYIAGVAAFAAGERGAALIDRPWFAASVAFGWLIAMTVANVRGLAVGKWIQNIGGIGTALAVLLVVGAALAVVASGGTLVPPPAAGTGWEMAAGFSVMCFAFVGIELASTMGDEIRNPQRDLPRAIAISGAIAIGS
jgi:hypothetical protein